MTDEQLAERIAAIEAYIAQQEREGKPWSGRSIYRALGGSHAIVNDYMKARAHLHGSPRAGQRPRTPPTTAEVRQAMAEQVPSTLAEDLDAARQAEQHAEERLSLLEEKSQREMLSESEEIEQVRLERRLGTLAVVITRLETEISQAKEVLDIDGFVAQWAPMADAKRALYDDFRAKAVELWQALAVIVQQHEQQILLIQTLPDGIQRYMLDTFLPDGATMRARLAANMHNPQGWTSILCQPGEPRVSSAEQLAQNDPGTQLLPPRLLQNALEQRRGVTLERSA